MTTTAPPLAKESVVPPNPGEPIAAADPPPPQNEPAPPPEPPKEPEIVLGDGPPAHVFEAAKVVDLRTLPWPEGTDGVNDCATHLMYDGPGDLKKVGEFYRKHFTSNGWKDVSSDQSSASHSYTFVKDEFCLWVSVSKSGQDEGVSIQMVNHGNYDLRNLPKPKELDAEKYEQATHLIYFSAAKVSEVADFYKKELSARGWRLADEHAYDQDISMDWINNGIQLGVSVGPAPAKGGMTCAQINVHMLRDELPILADCVIEEFSDYSGASATLTTKAAVLATAELLDKAMKGLGWEPVKADPVTDAGGILFFKRGEQTATVVLSPAEGIGTRVEMQTRTPPSKELLAYAKRVEQREKAWRERQKQIAKEALKVAIFVMEFPLPEAAYEVDRQKSSKQIQYKLKGSVVDGFRFYREKLADWKEKPEETMEQEGFGQLEFNKEKATIRIRIIKAEGEDVHRYYIDGTGLKIEGE